MDSHPWLLTVTIFLTLIVISLIIALGWAWRLPLILFGMGSRVTDRWSSRLRTNASLPVPNEEDEDYLETRSFA
jgi:hypothetical protein